MAGPINVASKVYSIAVAADLLGVSRAHAYRQARKPDENGDRWLVPGKVHILRLGACLRVPKAQLDALLSADGFDVDGPLDAKRAS